MPLYQYKCVKCGHVFDHFFPVDERETPMKEKCPECGKKRTIQIVLGAVVSIWKTSKPTS